MDDRKRKGLWFFAIGSAIVGIGLLNGGSVFLGNLQALDLLFDGLGSFWILRGIFLLVTTGS